MVLQFGVDVDIAFLYIDLKKEIYVKCPQGMSNIQKDDCIIWTSASIALFRLLNSIIRPSRFWRIQDS